LETSKQVKNFIAALLALLKCAASARERRRSAPIVRSIRMSQLKNNLGFMIIVLPVVSAIIVAMISTAGYHGMIDNETNAIVLNDVLKAAIFVF
jgi:hypothetical protein